jgi:hypothetical protein
VVFNPEPLAKFNDREYRSTVAQFAIFNVQQKFSLELSPDFKFPKMRYKCGMEEQQLSGKPPSQRIRKVAQKKVLRTITPWPLLSDWDVT